MQPSATARNRWAALSRWPLACCCRPRDLLLFAAMIPVSRIFNTLINRELNSTNLGRIVSSFTCSAAICLFFDSQSQSAKCQHKGNWRKNQIFKRNAGDQIPKGVQNQINKHHPNANVCRFPEFFCLDIVHFSGNNNCEEKNYKEARCYENEFIRWIFNLSAPYLYQKAKYSVRWECQKLPIVRKKLAKYLLPILRLLIFSFARLHYPPEWSSLTFNALRDDRVQNITKRTKHEENYNVKQSHWFRR